MTFAAKWKVVVGTGLFALLVAAPLCVAQYQRDQDQRNQNQRDDERYRDQDWDQGRGAYTSLMSGTVIPVRVRETIHAERHEDRVYTGTVTDDVRGNHGRLAIPRGSEAQLTVRVAPDNDLILDLESIRVNGNQYGVRSDATRVESNPGLVGAIVGAVTGAEVRGRMVNVPRDTVVTFRLDRPLEIRTGPDRDRK